jgi:hypothetical protein
MGSWIRRQGPAFVVACLALMVALGGSVYAAAMIDGRSIRPGSLPGNRVEKASLPGNRLRPGTLRGSRIERGSLTGVQVDASTLGEVPEAAHADSAGTARSANTALAANAATEASRLNGHSAGCTATQQIFAGACWDLQAGAAATAPQAAVTCANRGGELPSALALAAFGGQPGVQLALEGEWSREMSVYIGPNTYAVATVNRNAEIVSASAGLPHTFRCVIPLLS